jgi:hypothetical protein
LIIILISCSEHNRENTQAYFKGISLRFEFGLKWYGSKEHKNRRRTTDGLKNFSLYIDLYIDTHVGNFTLMKMIKK